MKLKLCKLKNKNLSFIFRNTASGSHSVILFLYNAIKKKKKYNDGWMYILQIQHDMSETLRNCYAWCERSWFIVTDIEIYTCNLWD